MRVPRSGDLYRVSEPAPGDGTSAAPERFEAVYADGPHNAEAFFVVGSQLFIVTKDREAAGYRATLQESGARSLHAVVSAGWVSRW